MQPYVCPLFKKLRRPLSSIVTVFDSSQTDENMLSSTPRHDQIFKVFIHALIEFSTRIRMGAQLNLMLLHVIKQITPTLFYTYKFTFHFNLLNCIQHYKSSEEMSCLRHFSFLLKIYAEKVLYLMVNNKTLGF